MPMNSKRPLEDSSIERPRMMPFNKGVTMGHDTHKEKGFRFRVLLPNSTTIEVKMSNNKRNEIPIEDLKKLVRKEYDRGMKQRVISPQLNRIINWEHQDLHFMDAQLKEIISTVNLCDFMPNKWHFLWLHDGSAETEVYEALHTLKTPKLEVEDDLSTGPASLYQKVLDVYGNHVEEGEIILLRVEGLMFQDGNDSTDCMKKVDIHGFVDLRNSLKVSNGYGKDVSLSVIFKDRVIFQQQFLIELRDITSVRKELEDNLITNACAVNDLKRELECLQYEQLHIQKEIKYLEGESRQLFFNASSTSKLAEKKLELAKMNKHLEETNKAYKQAQYKFLTTRDKYNNLSLIGSSSVSGTRK